ncbi:hypothetical protein TREES_T100016820 [Tupaia chinensis]|uniref:Interleukin-33 n=1 Tax=Tupaia chinensis TaxID=246437 RepID=L9L299_TUPCH|nr:hypothetical protein TREES_T100016820 [Tupaia chinensis]
MKYPTTQISLGKPNSTAGRALAKSNKLRRRKHKEPVFAAAPQQAAIARLASDTPGFYREHITSGRGISLLTGFSAFLSTYDDQFIKIVQEEGQYVMYVEDLMKDQKKGRVFPFVYNDAMI